MSNERNILETLLSTEEDAITIINKDKKVIFWNESAVHTYNIEKDQILNKDITDFFHDEDLMVLKVLITKKPVRNTYHRPRRGKHVVINASPIFNNQNELIGAVSVERDITQIVKLNDNLVMTTAELNELRQKVITDRDENPFSKMVGKSKALQDTIQIASKAAKTDATTLILGESGTGKEICARAIHESSSRKNGPFIPVNCGAIPNSLFESELFGYEGGAFTGAEKNGKAGKIEMADGGTLFLDEVGELPLDMQVKLLRVLQENWIYRIGDSKGKKVNVRFIAATNQNLERLIQEKKFREDLFYRLNVIQLTMPPLRNRAGDIPELIEFFLKQFANKYQVPVPIVKHDALQMLHQYQWPGNIRELRNLCERIVILSEKQTVDKEDLSSYFQNMVQETNPPQIEITDSFPGKEEMERRLIEEALSWSNGNKSKAAKKLGISRVTLYNKMKKYGLNG